MNIKISITRSLTRLLILINFCIFVDSSVAHNEGHQPSKKPPLENKMLGQILPNRTLTSKFTGSDHIYRIYLPNNYDATKQYPIIYMTDSQWSFNFYAETLDWKQKSVILVGLDQGSDFRRLIDFSTLGATDYRNLMKLELIPLIEEEFSSSGERTYMGISLGGLFGAVLLSEEPVGRPYFKNYLLFDGTFNFLTSRHVKAEEARYNADKKLGITLILTSSSAGNIKHVLAFEQRYKDRQYTHLKVFHKTYSIPHENIAAPSFGDFIDQIVD